MDQPHEHAAPVYGARFQYTKDIDTSTELGPVDTEFIQQVTGIFLYYARAVDAMMLMALSVIGSDQLGPTPKTMRKTLTFLDYVPAHPDAILTYSARGMVLNVYSNALHLTESKLGGTIHIYIPYKVLL